ncbi:hypothetical protein ACOSQ3_013867 [Xanthoceras sorbifolium]
MAARGALLKYLRVNAETPASFRSPSMLYGAVSPPKRSGAPSSTNLRSPIASSPLSKTSRKLILPRLHQKPISIISKMMALEEEFGFEIPDNEADKISSIDLAVDFIASHPQAK